MSPRGRLAPTARMLAFVRGCYVEQTPTATTPIQMGGRAVENHSRGMGPNQRAKNWKQSNTGAVCPHANAATSKAVRGKHELGCIGRLGDERSASCCVRRANLCAGREQEGVQQYLIGWNRKISFSLRERYVNQGEITKFTLGYSCQESRFIEHIF